MNYDKNYEYEQYLIREKNKIIRLVRLVTDGIDEIVEGDEAKPGEFDYLRKKLRELYSEYLDNQKKIEAYIDVYDVEEDIIEHLKY